MKTLEEIQDEVAKENNYQDTDYILVKCGPMFTKQPADIWSKVSVYEHIHAMALGRRTRDRI